MTPEERKQELLDALAKMEAGVSTPLYGKNSNWSEPASK